MKNEKPIKIIKIFICQYLYIYIVMYLAFYIFKYKFEVKNSCLFFVDVFLLGLEKLEISGKALCS